MGENIEPFELRETEGRMTLWLHGTVEQHEKVDVEKVPVILDAVNKGWNIDIEYIDIEGDPDAKMQELIDRSLHRSKIGNGKEFFELKPPRGYIRIVHSNMLFIRGTEERKIEVEADEILDAIAGGRDVYIEYAVIDGELDVRRVANRLRQDRSGKSVISGSMEVWQSEICGHISFGGVSFSKDVRLQGNTFREDANFSSSIFNREANFNGSRFENVGLSEAIFEGDVNFLFTTFRCVFFDGAVFKRFVTFHGTIVKEDAFFTRTVFERGAYLEDFTELPSKCFDSIGFAYRGSLMSGAGYFFDQAGKGYWSEEEYSHASESFRNAKVEYEKEGKYREAGKMYVKEMDSTRRGLKADNGSSITKRLWFCVKRIPYWIWKSTCNYGESPGRFIGWVAAIVCVFAFIYLPIIPNWISWWPSIIFKEFPFHQWSVGIIDGAIYNIVTALYFSAVTFATLGFGDIAPVNIVGKVFAIAEVLLGYLMFGVLITLVARKMTRS